MTGRARQIGDAVEVIPPEGYRTDLWYAARRQGVSASEVATIVGLSPYDSLFNLWWHKRLGTEDRIEDRADNPDTARGRRLEPLVLEDFSDAHPEFLTVHVGLLQNRARPWQFATPDQVVVESTHAMIYRSVDGGYDRGPERTHLIPVASVEAKTAVRFEGWGREGTDEVPLHYRAQALWQMDVLGVDVCYFPVWVGLDYREYVVERDVADLAWLREQAQAFLASLERDEAPPIDSSPRTTARLKYLHPTLEDVDAVVDERVVAQYLAAQRLRDAAADRLTLAENRLRHQLGSAARGVVPDPHARDGVRKVVSRSVFDVGGGTYTRKPYTGDRLTVSKPRRKP